MNPEYPKDVNQTLDGHAQAVRAKDKDALFTFFQRLPEGGRIFLKDTCRPRRDRPVADRAQLRPDLPDPRWKGNDVVRNATLHKNSAVDEARPHDPDVVAKDFHRKGMGASSQRALPPRLEVGLERWWPK